MGLLSGAYGLLDPILPADGLLDPMFGRQQQGSAPGPQAQRGGGFGGLLSGGLRVVDDVMGLGIGNAIDRQKSRSSGERVQSIMAPILSDKSIPVEQRIATARQTLSQLAAQGMDVTQWSAGIDAAERKAQIQKIGEGITDPVQKQLFTLDPEGYAKMLGERLKPVTLSEGQSLSQDGKITTTAPEMGVDGGYGYTQTPGGVTWGAQRGKSIAEILDEFEQAERERHNRQVEAIGYSNANRGWAAHNARKEAGGYGTPGVGGVGPASDLSDAELLQALGLE